MSVQKFIGTIETDGVKDERGIETPSLSATGEVSGKTGVFTESVTAPVFNGKATSAGTADSATNATNATNDGAGNNIPDTYATKEALAEETSAREAADETLSKGITAEATARAQEISALQTGLTGGTITVAEATHATSADNATNATNATNASNATHATSADSATTAQTANALTPAISVYTGSLDTTGRYWMVSRTTGEQYDPNGYYLPLLSFSAYTSSIFGGTVLHGNNGFSFFPVNLFSQNTTVLNGIINMSLQKTGDSFYVVFSYTTPDGTGESANTNLTMGSLGGDLTIYSLGTATLTLLRVA